MDDRRILAQLGLGAVLVLAPKIFGLFPGLIRCSLTVKTLLPETSTPGWLGIIIAPTYSLFLAMATITAIQTSEFIMAIEQSALGHKHGHRNPEGSIASQGNRPKGCLRHRERNQEEANDFQAAGVACIGVSVFLQVENADLSVINNLFLFVFSFIANVTLLTVVMSDFMLGMIRQGQLQAVAFAGTPLEKSLNRRLDDLAACGLTDLEAGELEFASSFKEKSGVLAKVASSQGSRLVDKARQLGNKTEEETAQPPPPFPRRRNSGINQPGPNPKNRKSYEDLGNGKAFDCFEALVQKLFDDFRFVKIDSGNRNQDETKIIAEDIT